MVEEGVRFLLIDVRDRKEVETTGSIQGAKLIPLPELKSALLLDEGDLDVRLRTIVRKKSNYVIRLFEM